MNLLQVVVPGGSKPNWAFKVGPPCREWPLVFWGKAICFIAWKLGDCHPHRCIIGTLAKGIRTPTRVYQVIFALLRDWPTQKPVNFPDSIDGCSSNTPWRQPGGQTLRRRTPSFCKSSLKAIHVAAVQVTTSRKGWSYPLVIWHSHGKCPIYRWFTY